MSTDRKYYSWGTDIRVGKFRPKKVRKIIRRLMADGLGVDGPFPEVSHRGLVVGQVLRVTCYTEEDVLPVDPDFVWRPVRRG